MTCKSHQDVVVFLESGHYHESLSHTYIEVVSKSSASNCWHTYLINYQNLNPPCALEYRECDVETKTPSIRFGIRMQNTLLPACLPCLAILCAWIRERSNEMENSILVQIKTLIEFDIHFPIMLCK